MAKSGANIINRILEEDDTYSQLKIYELIHRLVQVTPRNSKLAYQICAGFENNFADEMKLAGVIFPTRRRSKVEKTSKPLTKKEQAAQASDSNKNVYGGTASGTKVYEPDWKKIKDYVAAQLISDEPVIETVFAENVTKLGQKLNLSQIEIDVLKYVHALQAVDPSFHNFFGDLLKNEAGRFPAFIALALDKVDQFNEISKVLNPSGKLASFGILDFDNQDDYAGLPIIDSHIRDILMEGEFDVEQVVIEVVGTPVKNGLTVEKNFRHLEAQSRKIANALKAANEKGIKGVNIVLYGPPGSGKTELAKAIAKMAGLDAYAIGEDEESNMSYSDTGAKMDSSKRLTRLRQAQTFLNGSGKSVCIMDEMEDLILKGEDTSKKADTGSKILLNRTLEENAVPTIWLANDMDKFHASVRQRFSFPLYVGYQPTLIRQDIWAHHITKNNLQLDTNDALRLARLFDAPPRVIAQACQAAAILDGSFENIIEQVRDKASLDFGGDRSGHDAAYPVHESYALDCLQTNSDLPAIIAQFNEAALTQKPLSLLIKGDKDVGKSTLAYYLSEQSMRHIVSMDMDDMIIPTNQSQPVDNVSMAFAKASIMDAVLIIENMDALFSNMAENNDRQKMIARFMDEMQNHKLPIIMTERENGLVSKDTEFDNFKAFVDITIKLDKIPTDKLSEVYKRFVGTSNVSAAKPTAIGSIVRAVRSSTATPADDRPATIERRIAAQVSMSAGNGPTGFRKP